MSIVVRNLSDELVVLVRDRILAGAVLANKSIRQDALASELGVSKIPLREALSRLEHEGLLDSRAKRGFFVRKLTTKEAEEVFALRLKLEPETVATAAVLANAAEQRLAEETLAALDLVTNEHSEGVGPLNRAFHLAMIRPANQQVTTAFLERLHIMSQRYVHKHLEPLGRNERANKEHRQLLQAWLDRDGPCAAKLTITHISQTIDDLRTQLASEQ